MEAYRHDSVDTTPSEAASQAVQPASLAGTGLHKWVRFITRALSGAFGKSWEIVGADLSRPLPIYRPWVSSTYLANAPLSKDWRTHKYVPFGVLLALLTTLVVVAYYLNHPRAEPLADTISYLYVVRLIQTHGQLVNFWRLPGYPLFIVLVYTLTSQRNMVAVSMVQAILFLLATLELYILAVLILRRAWVAFLISLLVGANLTLLSYVKPIMSEALALWLLVSLALAVIHFLHTLQVRVLWLVTLCTLLLFMTRPEWIYLPVPLFAYLLLVAASRGAFRRLLPHVLLSVVVLYSILAGYIYINATQNHFPGLTWIENINALGKVLQYNMQNEAPPHYAAIRHILDTYVARGNRDPYSILAHQPSLSHNYAAPVAQFSDAIIERHPGEFLLKSVPVFFSSLTVYYRESSVAPTGPFGTPLLWLQSAFRALYEWNILFPPCALTWLLLLCWRRTRHLRMMQAMGAIILLSIYGLIITTLGAYRGYDYVRIHTLFNPLLILVIWSSLLLTALLLAQHGPDALAWLASRASGRQEISISTGTTLISSFSLLALCIFTVRFLLVPDLFSQVGVVFFLAMSVMSVS